MFAFDRSAAAVLMPLALLVAVVLLSRNADAPAAPQQARLHHGEQASDPGRTGSAPADQTVAANLPSR